MAFGDSVTAGYGLALSESYPAQLEQILKDKGYAVRVINAGVSGETTSGGLRRVDFAISQKPDIIILALGGNDVLRGIDPETSQSSLEGMLKAFQNAGISVVLVGMKAPLNLGFKYVNTFNAIYPNLAKTFDVPLVPFLLDGVALDPTLNQSDGIHPNAAGARIVAEKNILPVLLPLLKQAKS
jgi:acyl-CoA thioesterase-1